MKNKPFFSIITCTKNSEKYLPTCLSSLAAQSFKDYEHIVIDGYSVDNTLSLITKDSVLYKVKPSGISAAMNEGIKMAKGEYVYFLHSDDALHDSHVLSNVSQYLKTNSNLDWVYGQIQVIDESNKKIGIFPKYKIFQRASSYLLKFVNFVPHQAVFMKKAVFTQFGCFNTALKTCMDYDLWLRLARTTNWAYIPIRVADYRIHIGAQSSSVRNQAANMTELASVQKSYLNHFELVISSLLNLIITKLNKTTR